MLEVHKIEGKGSIDKGVMSGKFTALAFAAIKSMPGFHKWKDKQVYFELTRANVEHLRIILPEIVWHTDRDSQVMNRMEAEATLLRKRSNATKEPTPRPDFNFKTEPRDHQSEGFEYVKDLPYFGLFWEQGLGKTKTAFDVAAYKWSKHEIDTLLIMAPNGVHEQWVKEQLPTHLPDWVPRRFIAYRASAPQKFWRAFEYVQGLKEGLQIYSINEEAIFTNDGRKFIWNAIKGRKAMFIVDESHSIQTPKARTTKTALAISPYAKVRVIMTGTPVGTGLENLYTQLSFLHEDIMGFSSFYTFRNHFCMVERPPGNNVDKRARVIVGYKNIPELQKKMGAYCIRKTAEECLDLPERIPVIQPVPLATEQKRLYTEMKEDLITALESGEIVTAEQAIVKLIRMQQILSGFVKTDEGLIRRIPSYRIEAARTFIEAAGGKVVLWARFHEDIDSLTEAFKKLNPAVWDGRRTSAQKMEAKLKFMNDKTCGLFIANQASAGTGVDGLQTVCRSMLYYSNSYNARDRWQSESRLHRMGQKNAVVVGDLVAKGTMDVQLLARLKLRKDTADEVLDVDFIRELRDSQEEEE